MTTTPSTNPVLGTPAAPAAAPNVITSKRYRVRQGCSVIAPDGATLLPGGTLLPVGHASFDEKFIKDSLRERMIEPAHNAAEDARVAAPNVEPPKVALAGSGSSDPMESIDLRSVPKGNDALGVSVSGGASTTTTAPNSGLEAGLRTTDPITPDSVWNLDPAILTDKSLEQLNVMVLERDKGIAQFADADEARAWLSQDYKPPVT